MLLDKMPDEDDEEILDTRISALEIMVKKLNREVKQLKATKE